jgi:peptidoglycan/LPS O-acetylase OafA/YrhL
MAPSESSSLLSSKQDAEAGPSSRACGCPPSLDCTSCRQSRVWKAVSPARNLEQIFFRRAGSRSATSLDALDGLRACAYAWVVAYHCDIHEIAFSNLPGRFVPALIADGDGGVTIFLVLSGFLLAHIFLTSLDKEAKKQAEAAEAKPAGLVALCYGRFLYRRFARIYPSLVLGVLLVQAAVSPMYGEPWTSACGAKALPLSFPFSFIKVGGTLNTVLASALLVGNMQPEGGDNQCPSTWAPWTVSMEFQCYFLLPFLVLLFWRAPAAAWGVGLTVATLSAAARSTGEHNGHYHLPFLLCEYTMGVLAYFAACKRGLNWIGAGAGVEEHTLRRLHLVQLAWLASVALYVAMLLLLPVLFPLPEHADTGARTPPVTASLASTICPRALAAA